MLFSLSETSSSWDFPNPEFSGDGEHLPLWWDGGCPPGSRHRPPHHPCSLMSCKPCRSLSTPQEGSDNRDPSGFLLFDLELAQGKADRAADKEAECSGIILCQSHHLRPGRQSVTVGKAQGHEGHRIPPPPTSSLSLRGL